MRRPSHQPSPIERVATFATACGLTVGTTLVVFGALVPRVTRPSAITSALDARQVSEQLVFVSPSPSIPRAPAPAVVATRQRRGSSARADSRAVVASPAPELAVLPPPDTSSSKPSRAVPVLMETKSEPRATAGAPVASAVVGFARSSRPVRFDSVLRRVTDSIGIGLAVGAIKPPPPTQAETDAKWRDEAFEVVAARTSGVPLRRTMAGSSIAVPLPFGGPTRKQRERDRAKEAELKPNWALRQQKVDSIKAARQRGADSLARLPDSLRLGARRQH
jgi:hypothetical protein